MTERVITITVDENDVEEAAAEIETHLSEIGVMADVEIRRQP